MACRNIFLRLLTPYNCTDFPSFLLARLSAKSIYKENSDYFPDYSKARKYVDISGCSNRTPPLARFVTSPIRDVQVIVDFTIITKVWTIRVACELSFQRRVCFSEGCKHSRNSEKNTALQRSAMSIENGIPTLPHSSGVLCVLKGYTASLRKILKIVQSLV